MGLLGKGTPVPTANGISLDEAYRVIMAARKKAEEIGFMQNIAEHTEKTQNT